MRQKGPGLGRCTKAAAFETFFKRITTTNEGRITESSGEVVTLGQKVQNTLYPTHRFLGELAQAGTKVAIPRPDKIERHIWWQ